MSNLETIKARIAYLLKLNPNSKPRHLMADTILTVLTNKLDYGQSYRLLRKLWKEIITPMTDPSTITTSGNGQYYNPGTGEPNLYNNTLIGGNYTATINYSVPTTSIVGIIADTHEPYCHIDYKDFVAATFKEYGVNRVVHIGDEVDNYALSYHEKNPDAPSAVQEAEKAQAEMDKWYAMFPDVDVLVGNHSALPHRKATTIGIPKKFIKTYEEIWEAPKGWKWHMELEIDGVNYTHGLFCSGVDGAIKRAIASRQSVVVGHSHSFGGVNYHSATKDTVFGLNVGCGVDQKAYAFDFSKGQATRWTLGCGIVKHGKLAIFVPMLLNAQGRWVR